MFGYNPYQNYGPANALADIVGAYVQKKSQQDQFTGIMQGLQNYQGQLDNVDLGGNVNIQDQASPNNPNSNYYNKTARTNITNNLMPSTDFQGQANSNNLGSGLIGGTPNTTNNTGFLGKALNPNYFSQTPQQKINLVSDENGNAIQNNDGTYTANLSDGTQKTIMSDQNGYAIMPQDAPQYYKDWYKPDASNITKPFDQYSTENNPMKVTVSAPKSLTEAKTSIMGTIPQAAMELAKKGYDPSVFMPMLQQAAKDRLDGYQQTYNSQQLNGLMNQFNASNNPYQRAMIAAQMKQYGLDLDPKMISTLQPDFKLTSVDQGDRHTLVLHDPKTGTVINAESLATNLNPNTKYTADMGYKGKIDAANIGASARIATAGMRGSGHSGGSGGNNGKINGMTDLQMDNEISKERIWKEKNPDANLEDYPRYNQYMKAADPYGNTRQADDIIAQIKAANPDASNDEIYQYLYKTLGYGQD